MLKGIGASPGVVLGKALLLEEEELVIEKKVVNDTEAEVTKLREAVAISKEELIKVKEKALVELGEHEAQIFESHLLVLEDPELLESAVCKINDEKVNAEFALNEIKEMFVTMFESMDNEYMRERAADIKDVTNRIIRHLLGVKVVDLANLSEEVVLVAHDLTPSDTATMDKKKVLGFLTDIGGRTSHTAIMSRTLEIAAIVGLNDATKNIKDGDFVVFNGDTGEVIVNPDEETIATYKKLKTDFEEYKKALELLKGQATVTTDNKHVELAGNIGTPSDVEGLIKNDAEGVGLYRTEFLYMDRSDFPSEEEQYEAYKAVLEGMSGKPIVIRTLDIGGDKKLDYLQMDEEMNPFLGYRAIRLCLDRKEIFKTQLRALYRASVHGKLRIMFPMISSLEELLQAKEVCEEVKAELKAEKVAYSDEVEDKNLDYLQMDEEMNPFLGYRAIRLCLDRKEIFKTQLRALYRASVHGKLRIMFPMISSLEELLQAKEVCEEVKAELKAEKVAYSDEVEVGMMIEVPSAAVISDVLAKHVDFFSIGTNDLIQYTCAVDRMNQKISYLYNQFNPAVLRLIKMVIDNAHKEGKWAGMCGESAGDQLMIPILLGFGLDEFSMSPISILPARKLINSLSFEEMKKFSEEVLALGTAQEIKNHVIKTFNK